MMLSNTLDIPSSDVTTTKFRNVQLKQLSEKYCLEKSRRGFAKLSMLTSHYAKKANIANLAIYNYQSIGR